MTEEIVLNTSCKAAEYRTDISGWVSRGGLYFGEDEAAARHAGCTHVLCRECGAVIPKEGHTVCLSCREKWAVERYEEMDEVEWDGDATLYSTKLEMYLPGYNLETLEEYADSHDCTVAELRLVICEPVYLRPIDDDFGCGELPDGGELPEEVWEALENFNDTIRHCEPVSWSPGETVPIFGKEIT